ncbi:receptor-type tyrosine-protein phosphatase C-like, partial [Oculina patagonica]
MNVMEEIEEKALASAPVKPRWWRRYVDDSNACLKSENIRVFHSHLNSINPHIQFTIEMPTTGAEGQTIAFLDTSNTVSASGQVEVGVAGVGRTGTYIVLDAMLDQIAAEGVVDIYGFVCHIRQQRSSMVQTEAQYIFIHDALMEYVTCGTTEFVVRELPEKLRILNTVDPDSGDSLLVAEFK